MKSISLKKATFLNATAKYATVIINIIVTAILSRILSPNDYGIVAVINAFDIPFCQRWELVPQSFKIKR